MTDELKPVRCGCGGRPIIEYGEDGICRVRCSFCLTGTVYHRNKSEAIEAWNRAMGSAEKSSTVERTAKVETYTDDQQETWSVCECGTDVWKIYNYCPECGAKLDWSE